MKWLVGCVLSLVLIACGSLAWAQDATKIGYVNTERILRDAAPAKVALQKIEGEFGKRDKELQDMAARLKGLGEKLERDAAVLQDSDRIRRQREVADLEKDFQRKQREFREDLNQRRNEELAQVVEKAQKVIKQVAEQEKFDIVIGDAVFVSTRIDITDKVIKALSTTK
jgi:outer membrane protein